MRISTTSSTARKTYVPSVVYPQLLKCWFWTCKRDPNSRLMVASSDGYRIIVITRLIKSRTMVQANVGLQKSQCLNRASWEHECVRAKLYVTSTKSDIVPVSISGCICKVCSSTPDDALGRLKLVKAKNRRVSQPCISATAFCT